VWPAQQMTIKMLEWDCTRADCADDYLFACIENEKVC
jgi:hypothetical protein